MGMAASQARYLGLTARKTNCEWEGQQINQARTALANQSANYFNQLLTLEVPDCPDKTDYTKTQYSYSDGNNNSVLDNWRQLSDSTNDYNYIVDHYYYADIYTGAKKLMSDPQVTIKNDSTEEDQYAKAGGVVYNADAVYDPITGQLLAYGNSYTTTTEVDGEEVTTYYQDLTNFKYDKEMQNAVLDLIQQGLIVPAEGDDWEQGTVSSATLSSLRGWHDGNAWHFATVDELENSANKENWEIKDGYADFDGIGLTKANIDAGLLTQDQVTAAKEKLGFDDDTQTTDWLKAHYQDGNEIYKIEDGSTATEDVAYTAAPFRDLTTTFDPQYVGNAKLTELASLSAADEAALAQIAKDCKDSTILDYVTLNTDGSINYDGAGIYTFEWNGVQKYTTYEDLVDSMQTPMYNEKPIDAQYKLATYEANYVTQEVKETDKALLETDGEGRFKSVRFEDDSTTYVLNCETVTDEDAYNDAMNQYYQKVQEYEKQIADINAKTEVIQQQDRTLELRLKQLDTEQNALQTEMEAVKKVISKNVEMTFKTFSGS